MSDENFGLTDDQCKKILELWNSANGDKTPPTLQEIVDAAFGPGIDTRSKDARKVRAYLASRQLKPKTTTTYAPRPEIELNDEHKEFIANNCHSMTAIELAQIIFKNNKIVAASKEVKAVIDYLKTLDNKILYKPEETFNITTNTYFAPKTENGAIKRVNKYIDGAIPETGLTPKHKKDLKSLIGYLNTYRFLSIINSFSDQTDRDLFESEFIRCAYDKGDLLQEEVDQYIMYAQEVVIGKNINKRIFEAEREQDRVIAETGRISQAMVEMIKELRTSHKECVKTQNDIIKKLSGERNIRLGEKIKTVATIHNIIECWKDEENRQIYIKQAELRKELLKDELKRLHSMESIKAQLLGLTEDETLN